jgi:hypothetical protein
MGANHCPFSGVKQTSKIRGAMALMTQLGHRTDARDAPHNSRLTMC